MNRLSLSSLSLAVTLLMPQLLIAAAINSSDVSPYIRMHVGDAVNWQRWDSSIPERAQKENKLILISSGYFSCHWCHVMREESFNHPRVASILNSHFIPVKIDREVLPVLDDYLIDFMNQTQGYAGWPLNVFLTPQGYPVTGLVYQPRNKFIEVLELLRQKWQKDQQTLETIAEQVFDYTQQQNAQHLKASANDLKQALLYAVQGSMDEFEGGFGEQTKFPMPHLMLALIEVYDEEAGQQWLESFLKLSLEQMATKGLHDAVGGGFYRYTIDQSWQLPHFEKMLYTNASMIRLYTRAADVFDEPRWLQVAEETLEFVLREMKGDTGAYVSALTAQDRRDEEGGDYVWTQGELEQRLKAEQVEWLKQRAIKLDTGGYFPHGLWLSGKGEKIKQRLLERRKLKRVQKDAKLVFAWNAYLLVSMIELEQALGRGRYTRSIDELRRELDSVYTSHGPGMHLTDLQDHVFYLEALWKWAVMKNEASAKERVAGLTHEVLERFYNQDGWLESSEGIIPMPGRVLNMMDRDLPASEAVFMRLVGMLPAEVQRGLRQKVHGARVDSRVLVQPMLYATYIASHPRSD